MPSDAVGTRGALAGRGNVTRALLYLSEGSRRHSTENRVNTINTGEVDHTIRGNLVMSTTS